MKTPQKPKHKPVAKRVSANKEVNKTGTTIGSELVRNLLTENPRKLSELLTLTNIWHDEQQVTTKNLDQVDLVYEHAQALACRAWSNIVHGSPPPNTIETWEKSLVGLCQEIAIDAARVVLQLQKNRETDDIPSTPP